MSTGVFDTSGQNFRPRRRRRPAKLEPLERFAELLSDHVDEDDVAQGLGDKVDPGGSITIVCGRMGIPTRDGYRMFARICRGLGDQAYDCVSKGFRAR